MKGFAILQNALNLSDGYFMALLLKVSRPYLGGLLSVIPDDSFRTSRALPDKDFRSRLQINHQG